MNQHMGDLIPRAIKASARRVGRIIPGALVAARVNGGQRVEDEAGLGGIALVAGERVGIRQVIRRLEGERLNRPGVIGADEIMDAFIFADVAGAGVRVVGIGKGVAFGAGDMARFVKGGPCAAPGAPARAAGGAAGETI
jgi:hypothetical protein